MDDHAKPSSHGITETVTPPVQRPRWPKRAVWHVQRMWFEWIFVAILGVVIAGLAWLSDEKLGSILAIAERIEHSLHQDTGGPASSQPHSSGTPSLAAKGPFGSAPQTPAGIGHPVPSVPPQQSNPAQPARAADATSHTATPIGNPSTGLAPKPAPAAPPDLRTVIESYFQTQIETRQSDRRFRGLRLVLTGDPAAWETGAGVDACEISFRVIDGDQHDVMPSDTLKEMASSRNLNAHDLQARACFTVIDKIIYRIGLS